MLDASKVGENCVLWNAMDPAVHLLAWIAMLAAEHFQCEHDTPARENYQAHKLNTTAFNDLKFIGCISPI